MKIDFNHVRKKAGDSYNELIKFLQSWNKNGTICFDDRDIEETLFDLRSAIGAIMCTSEENDEGFKCMHNNPHLTVFETFEEVILDESDCNAE